MEDLKDRVINFILVIIIISALVNIFASLSAQAKTIKHVSITGLDGFDVSAQELKDYWSTLLTPLNLDLELVYDDRLEDGDIRIVFSNAPCPDSDQFGTRQWTFYTNGPKIGGYQILYPYKIQLVKLYKECLYKYDDTNRRNAIFNAVTHELFCHALTDDTTHLQHIFNVMAKPLCNPYLNTDQLYFTWADKRRLLEAYGQHGKKMSFTNEDIGKTCYLLYENGDKSFSFPITSEEMVVDWILPNSKKVKKVIK